LLEGEHATEAQLQAAADRVAAKVEEAVRFAETSEDADPELPFDLMFVGRKA
jgi:TPP-dependent pyruvate/acetoin dehydrogenase alpha subunit